MNPRERTLATLVGAGLGVAVLYWVVNGMFIQRYQVAQKQIDVAKREAAKIEAVLKTEKDLVRRWKDIVARTFSQESPIVVNKFGEELKRLAHEHNLQQPSFKWRPGAKIDRKDITSIDYIVSATGTYTDVVAFLRSLYERPYVAQVTKLSISPLETKGARNSVKIDQLVIETPLMPSISPKDIPDAADAEAMDKMISPPEDAWRISMPKPEVYATLQQRNIFRMYMPPPIVTVKVDNQDLKPVMVKMTCKWEDKVLEQPTFTVPGKKAEQSPEGRGDIVEVAVTYEDKTEMPPQAFSEANSRKPWVVKVPAHTPPEPPAAPTLVDLTVENQDKDRVDVEVEVHGKDKKISKKPTIVVNAGQKQDLDQYTDVESVKVVAWWDKTGNKKAVEKSFTPAPGKQTLVVPIEPPAGERPVVVVDDAKPPPPVDPAPDASLSVRSLAAYGDAEELVADNTRTHHCDVYKRGDAMDGGVLVAVHPLGALVWMEPTGNYYFYRLGQSFKDRVLLEGVKSLAEVGPAIDKVFRTRSERTQ